MVWMKRLEIRDTAGGALSTVTKAGNIKSSGVQFVLNPGGKMYVLMDAEFL